MAKRLPLINGHPDGRGERFCPDLAAAYEAGAGADSCVPHVLPAHGSLARMTS